MSANSKYLERKGWRFHSRKRNGMMHIVKWIDPTNGEVMKQGIALQTQRLRNRYKKGQHDTAKS